MIFWHSGVSWESHCPYISGNLNAVSEELADFIVLKSSTYHSKYVATPLQSESCQVSIHNGDDICQLFWETNVAMYMHEQLLHRVLDHNSPRRSGNMDKHVVFAMWTLQAFMKWWAQMTWLDFFYLKQNVSGYPYLSARMCTDCLVVAGPRGTLFQQDLRKSLKKRIHAWTEYKLAFIVTIYH